ncbi:MAG TPA: LLM class flavin-dependent oxidoreductase [Candidatus Limnocylindrales bacterium]|nr:LLM class flavin-dependent oxidoreductase [Candidatus Limnocylindrales bacterium]
MPRIRIGANCWNQYTDWASLLEAGRRADRLGYDSLWTWDHVYPIVGSDDGPMFEGWTTLTAWAMATEKVTLGLMVGANTFREPTLTAKMATCLDHISNGRAVLGIGGAWFRTEHEAFGFDYGDGPPERLRWLGQALPVMRGMLHGTRPSSKPGDRYHARAVRNDPPPIQSPLPILVGGGGEKVTLKLAAKYADMHDVGGDVETVRRKDRILRQHCEAVGRDFDEIERTSGIGRLFIRDSAAEAKRVAERTFASNGGARYDALVGSPEEIAEHLAPLVELGRRHLIANFPSPYDEESMTRFATEVRPRLEAAVPA